MTPQNDFIPFNFENAWIFCKIYSDIYIAIFRLK